MWIVLEDRDSSRVHVDSPFPPPLTPAITKHLHTWGLCRHCALPALAAVVQSALSTACLPTCGRAECLTDLGVDTEWCLLIDKKAFEVDVSEECGLVVVSLEGEVC